MLSQIIAASQLSPQDVVIEVGPGLGILTRELARKARQVIAIELDPRLAELLERELATFANVTIVRGNALDFSPEELLNRHANAKMNYKVVANLPYYLASALLCHFVEAARKPSLLVVTVQREVGEVIAAASGKMRLLSLAIQLHARPQTVALVPPKAFYPSPKVDSLVLRLDTLPAPAIQVSNVESLFALIRCGFSSPRKQLRNSMAQGLSLPAEEVGSMLESISIDPHRRAETLNLEEWQKVWEKFTPRLPKTENVCQSNLSF